MPGGTGNRERFPLARIPAAMVSAVSRKTRHVMLGRFLAWLTGNDPWFCEFHDRPSEAKIARLEVATGIDPLAEERMLANPSVHSFYDPDLVYCGSSRCRRRRGLPA